MVFLICVPFCYSISSHDMNWFVDVSLMIHRYANWGKEVKNEERHSFFSSWFETPPYPQAHSGRILNGFKHYLEGAWIKKAPWDWSRHRVASWNRCAHRICLRLLLVHLPLSTQTGGKASWRLAHILVDILESTRASDERVMQESCVCCGTD